MLAVAAPIQEPGGQVFQSGPLKRRDRSFEVVERPQKISRQTRATALSDLNKLIDEAIKSKIVEDFNLPKIWEEKGREY